MNEDPHTTTVTLRRIAPVWAWLRENFKLPAVLTILLIIGGWVVDRFTLSARVTVLEEHWHIIERVVPDQAEHAALKERVDGIDERLGRVEKNWDDASKAADLPPSRRHR